MSGNGRGNLVKSGVWAQSVVNGLHVDKDIGLRLSARFIMPQVNKSAFEAGEKVPGHSIDFLLQGIKFRG